MQGLIQVIGCFLFSLLCLSHAWAADLKTCVDAYQKSVDEIRRSSQTGFEEIQQIYGKALETQKASFQSQGDLKKTRALLAESERFQKVKILPPAPDENEIQEIKSLQAGYVKRYSTLEQEMVQKLLGRTFQYEKDLTRLLKELTKAGKLDAATEVEAEHVKALSEIKNFAEQLAALKAESVTDGNLVPNARISATAAGMAASQANLYLVIDLSGGSSAEKYPVSYLSAVPKGGWTDEFKTDKLVMRRIEPGTFVMGSPEDELGRKGDETQHEVTLTKSFYIGVFEVTQRQWELVMGRNPSRYTRSYASRPVEHVSYEDARGSGAGLNGSGSDHVDSTSFMGQLRMKAGKVFDLPSESQWEYACRAGMSTALNSGNNLISTNNCQNMSMLGRYAGNSDASRPSEDTDVSSATAKVGSYKPNAFGLYDMHGNVWEWCLEQYKSYAKFRILRGGAWAVPADSCRAACRANAPADRRAATLGFRLACAPDEVIPVERIRESEQKAGDEITVVSKPVEPELSTKAGKKISLNLDAKPGKRGGNTKSSYNKVRNLTCDIAIRLTSFDVKQVEAQVKVYFVGKDGDDRRLVADWQEKTITLDQSKAWADSITSKDIREQTPYYYYYYYNDSKRWVSGAKLEGWIVQVWVGGQLVAKKASLNPLLRYENVMKEMGVMQEGGGGGAGE